VLRTYVKSALIVMIIIRIDKIHRASNGPIYPTEPHAELGALLA